MIVVVADNDREYETVDDILGAGLHLDPAGLSPTFTRVEEDEVPIVRGASGLTGRPQIARGEEMEQPEGYDPETGEPIWGSARAVGQAIPSRCQMVMSSPRETCPGAECKGSQRDGGCLCDIVRAARAAGVKWSFEVDPHDNFWDYTGEPIPGFVTERGDYGQVHTRWLEGHEPQPQMPKSAAPVPPSFVCPHCGEMNDQDPTNFHWWCGHCGKNANDGG